MKKIIISLFICIFTVEISKAQDTSVKAQLDSAIQLIKEGKHLSASQRLLSILNVLTVPTARPRLKYLLGNSLMELNLNQAAAFQFADVIRSGDVNWTRPAIEKLLIVTDKLGDETLLNFAIQRVEISQIPEKYREMIYFRLADIKHKTGFQEEAVGLYRRVSSKSRYFYSALYNMGLAQAELGQPDEAIKTFKRLINARAKSKANDTNKVSALIAIARTLYQKQDWARSIETYSKVPRDHFLWHSALFEKTWAMLRSGRFRSTLSNFQSLHSSFYDDAYLPETLLLRAIVYLYICQYDEMEKVLAIFDNQYGDSLKKVEAFLKKNDMNDYFNELYAANEIREGKASEKAMVLPYNIMKYISNEGDIRRSYAYLNKIIEEKNRVEETSSIKNSSIGEYTLKLLNNRINGTKISIGAAVKKHLSDIKNELTDLTEQSGFIRYEMINGRKELLKRKIEGKTVKPSLAKSSGDNREFYVQNGYEYYPFQGEYWLDEIGNYHYLGKQSCE